MSAAAAATQAGLDVVDLRQEALRMEFFDSATSSKNSMRSVTQKAGMPLAQSQSEAKTQAQAQA